MVATALLALSLAASLTSVAARTKPSDALATRSYLQTDLIVYRAILVNTNRGVVASEELAARVSRECPGVAATAPRGGQTREKLALETAYAALLTFLTPDQPAFRAAADTLSNLHWSNRRLTALVHTQAREASGAFVPLPDVCGDWRAWVASGSKVLPVATARFLAQIESTFGERGPEIEERIASLLRRYEGAREVALRRHLVGLRRLAVQHATAGLLASLGKVEKAIGLRILMPNQARPRALLIQPPPAVVHADGKRLEEFYAGRAVAVQSGCLACHRIGEHGNSGPGPDLTHIASRLPGLAIARTLVKPTAPMPSFRHLPKAKFNALVEFLSLLH